VTAGKVAAGPWVRLACKRHLADLKARKRTGHVWDLARAVKAIEFFSEVLVLEDGAPFKLEPFQQFIVGSLFGWYNADGYRRFRDAYVEMGKGNGKSPLAAGIGIYGLVADGEAAPEVYSAATMRDQAKIVFTDAKRMVEGNPELADMVGVNVGSLTFRNGVFRPVSSEHKGLDGLRVHVGLIDELHEHPSGMVVDKIRAGTKRQRNALVFRITNSGFDRTSVCWNEHDYSIKVLQGTVQNEAWFAYVCALDDEEKWTDLRELRKANPGLGTILPESYLREQVKSAQGMPSKENIVKRLNGCVWTEQSERWLDLAAWDACGGAIDLAALRGKPCMMGLDAASTNDFAATCKLFEDEGRYVAAWRFWLPEGSLEEATSPRPEAVRIQLREWADRGFITLTPGPVIDYDHIEAEILKDAQDFDVQRLAFDRWNVTQLVTHLRDALGSRYNPATGKDEPRVFDFPQTMAQMSAPSKELEKLVTERKLRHGGNPVARWMASNVTLRYGPNAQIKPDRERSGDKIDGIIALVMALDMASREAESGPSVYEERGLLVL
jgi:phage terminase large subunit-like protein